MSFLFFGKKYLMCYKNKKIKNKNKKNIYNIYDIQLKLTLDTKLENLEHFHLKLGSAVQKNPEK